MSLSGITMFRARDGLHSLDELIRDRAKAGEYEFEDFKLDDDSIALVYYKVRPIQAPRWASFFQGIMPEGALRSGSASAVVAFQREGRWYLVTFGYGRHFLDLDRVEPSFGLRVALNAIDPSLIRSVDKKRVDTVSRMTREQLSKDSRIGAFGLDIHQDLLSAVTGVPSADDLGTRVYGKDAVGLRVEVQPQELGLLADRLELLFQDDSYKHQFRWVDNISEVRGAPERRSLTGSLIQRIRDGDREAFDLAPPEIVDWSRALGFVYPREPQPRAELTLDDYFDVRPAAEDVEEEVLKRDRIRLVDMDGNPMGGWSVFRCITGEITRADGVYVINDGKWYRIARDFDEEISEFVAGLRYDALELPPFLPDDEDEAGYNARVAAQSGGALACMDEKFIWPRSWQDRIEFCDLYRSDGLMVHVKRYTKGSATLSHLFFQGGVSARCLLSDRQFLANLDDKLPESHSLHGAAPDPSGCHVVFAVVAKRGRDQRLPFFSRVSLRNSAEAIRNLGVRVSYQIVPNNATE